MLSPGGGRNVDIGALAALSQWFSLGLAEALFFLVLSKSALQVFCCQAKRSETLKREERGPTNEK